MKYEYMADFDTENVEDEQTMAERFYFSGNVNKYSYNQAVFAMGNHLRNVATHRLNVVGRFGDKRFNLYHGANCFYDWFLKEDADSLRLFDLVNFHDEENDRIYQLDRIKENGEYLYYVTIR